MPLSDSDNYEQYLDHWYEYMEGKQEAAEWDKAHWDDAEAPCNNADWSPACDCEWRDLRNGRYYKTHCCEACVDPITTNPSRKQITTIKKKLSAIEASRGGTKKRLNRIHSLFSYICQEADFVRSHPNFWATIVAKAKEFRADERAASIFPLLDHVIISFELL